MGSVPVGQAFCYRGTISTNASICSNVLAAPLTYPLGLLGMGIGTVLASLGLTLKQERQQQEHDPNLSLTVGLPAAFATACCKVAGKECLQALQFGSFR
jgi:hypothetical protein